MVIEHPTCIIRHKRENLKKCSLRGLEGKKEYLFFLYPDCALKNNILPDLSGYVVLDLDGSPLSQADSESGLVLIDATWRLAEKMTKELKLLHHLPKRSIPQGFLTAYPRRQLDCKNPETGLASIEALYIANTILGRDTETLLDNYHWKLEFLEKNREAIKNLI